MKTKLFLSNAEIIDEPFIAFCETNEIELVAKSLIVFKPVDTGFVPAADVVFFSSPRSVDFFLKQTTGNYLFACLGKGTTTRLESYGLHAEFIGSGSGDPDQVANAFISWLGERTVLFPLSAISNRSVSSKVPAEQRIELVVYETVAVSQVLESFDVYVFTSPSNVVSFLDKNQIPSHSKVIAWGKTTERKLRELQISCTATLEHSSLRELEFVLAH